MTDLKAKEKLTTEQWLRDASKPSLENLSYALRHPETWPKGFYWDFDRCSTCAMGLANRLWEGLNLRVGDPNTTISDMAREFAIPYAIADNIFGGQGHWVPVVTTTDGHLWWKETKREASFEDVTPEMVADQIDKYIAEQK